MARTKQTARKNVGGRAPRQSHASRQILRMSTLEFESYNQVNFDVLPDEIIKLQCETMNLEELENHIQTSKRVKDLCYPEYIKKYKERLRLQCENEDLLTIRNNMLKSEINYDACFDIC